MLGELERVLFADAIVCSVKLLMEMLLAASRQLVVHVGSADLVLARFVQSACGSPPSGDAPLT
jgi:hypothetical protein